MPSGRVRKMGTILRALGSADETSIYNIEKENTYNYFLYPVCFCCGIVNVENKNFFLLSKVLSSKNKTGIMCSGKNVCTKTKLI